MCKTLISLLAIVSLFLMAASVSAEPPTVTQTSPELNHVNVPADTRITISFSTELDPATATSDNMLVHSSWRGRIPGSFSYITSSHSIQFEPDEPFKAGEQVFVTASDRIRSSTGDPMATGYVFSFLVRASSGTATFKAAREVVAGNKPRMLALADVNSDGLLDIFLTDNLIDTVTLLLNHPGARFEYGDALGVGDRGGALCTGDFDGDGDPDLAVAPNVGRRLVRLTNQNGFFFGADTLAGNVGGDDLRAADMDGDGDIDLISIDGTSRAIELFRNDGSGGFGPKESFATGSGNFGGSSLEVADYDNDGDLDVATVNDEWMPYRFDVSILLNDGSGALTVDTIFTGHNGISALKAGDINSDGWVDLAIACDEFHYVWVLHNYGGYFAGDVTHDVASTPSMVELANFDGDNDLDLATPCWADDQVSVQLNLAGMFVNEYLIPAIDGPTFLVSGDLDNDGDIDLVANAEGFPPLKASNSLSVLLNQSAPCCDYETRGDIDENEGVSIGDLTVMVDFLFINPGELACWEAGNIDGTLPEGEGSVTIGDLTVLIDHLYISLADLPRCP